MKDCPRCFAVVDGLVCPKCGYAEAGVSPAEVRQAIDPYHFLCCHEVRGQRCANYGTLSMSVGGKGPTSNEGTDQWFCPAHFPPFRGMGSARAVAKDCPEGYWEGWKRALNRPKPLAKVIPFDFEAVNERMALQAEGEATPVPPDARSSHHGPGNPVSVDVQRPLSDRMRAALNLIGAQHE